MAQRNKQILSYPKNPVLADIKPHSALSAIRHGVFRMAHGVLGDRKKARAVCKFSIRQRNEPSAAVTVYAVAAAHQTGGDMNTAATRYVRRIYGFRKNQFLIKQSFDLATRINDCFKTAIKNVKPDLSTRLVLIHSKAVKRFIRRNEKLIEFCKYQSRWSYQ